MSSSIAGTADARPELIASTIPILDVAPYLAGEVGALKRLGAELRWAFENVGFYYLRGHGIPPSLIDATFAQAARFHALPLERKLSVKVNEDNVPAGRRARTPRSSCVVTEGPTTRWCSPAVVFMGSTNGRRNWGASARPGSLTCRRWRRCASAWWRSTPRPSTCRRMPSRPGLI